jgi:kanamycin kinase
VSLPSEPVPVPEVVDHIARGRPVTPVWVNELGGVTFQVGAGLKLLHDALPVDESRFGPPPWVVADAPPADRLVVCHGDPCAPDTLIDEDSRCCGHVDLGDLGIADPWADLAVAMMSLSWNYSGSWGGELLDAYGIDADPARIDYYQRLWEAGDISSR